jgi:glucuronokinase
VFQSGLSGSSGIVCAALNCFLDFYKVRHLIMVEVRPYLILAAEKELGIFAGLQDRVVQVYGGLFYLVHCLISTKAFVSNVYNE